MKYTAKLIEENVNVSQISQVKELFILLLGSITIICGIYFLSGLLVDGVVEHLPDKVRSNLEYKLYSGISTRLDLNYNKNLDNSKYKIQEIFKLLLKNSNLSDKQRYTIRIINSNEVNAYALPGGRIYITSGLISEVGSDEELGFVIAHELGHFAHKDHLKSLGRKVLIIGISALFSGGSDSVSNFLVNSVETTEMKFSQKQEFNADIWAFTLINKTYHSTSGAFKFMERISKKEKLNKFVYFFVTHPHPEDRLANFRAYKSNK